jgi:hypothetical protein
MERPQMEKWRSDAIENLPEMRTTIAATESVMALGIDLRMKFEDAYQEPRRNQNVTDVAFWLEDGADGFVRRFGLGKRRNRRHGGETT